MTEQYDLEVFLLTQDLEYAQRQLTIAENADSFTSEMNREINYWTKIIHDIQNKIQLINKSIR
jgi:hypothetical protein